MEEGGCVYIKPLLTWCCFLMQKWSSFCVEQIERQRRCNTPLSRYLWNILMQKGNCLDNRKKMGEKYFLNESVFFSFKCCLFSNSWKFFWQALKLRFCFIFLGLLWLVYIWTMQGFNCQWNPGCKSVFKEPWSNTKVMQCMNLVGGEEEAARSIWDVATNFWVLYLPVGTWCSDCEIWGKLSSASLPSHCYLLFHSVILTL